MVKYPRMIGGDGPGLLHCSLPTELTTSQATKAACPVVRALDGRTYPSTVTLKNTQSIINTPDYIHAGAEDSICLVSHDPVSDEYWILGVECPA